MPRKSVVRLTDHLDMTVVVEWDVKQQNKQINQKLSFRSNELQNNENLGLTYRQLK